MRVNERKKEQNRANGKVIFIFQQYFQTFIFKKKMQEISMTDRRPQVKLATGIDRWKTNYSLKKTLISEILTIWVHLSVFIFRADCVLFGLFWESNDFKRIISKEISNKEKL